MYSITKNKMNKKTRQTSEDIRKIKENIITYV